ncbi:hypothetical protein EVAR_102054_1 [Eumeta japonica]|uniref:Reverse transcriptase domain-containing protein n=1 Tax=Eumeta variegata TaxID=151549 RepID=A0A4C1TZT4_EUMVA|nr:hypothetical protein EVAR_102054_1 [Eumeta japonica]
MDMDDMRNRFVRQRRRPLAGSGFALHRMGRACGTASTGSSGNGKNREDVLLQTDSGRVLGPNEWATLLAETFFPDDRVDTDDPHHADVRRQTDGIGALLKSSILERPWALMGSHRTYARRRSSGTWDCSKQWRINASSWDTFSGLGRHLMPNLQATQYGFTPQRETEDALYDLMTYMCKELNLKKIVLIVSLDIEGPFDNAWWPVLKT